MNGPVKGQPVRQKTFWRRAAAWGAQKGPAWFVLGAPAVIGLFFAIVSWDARRAVRRNLRWIHGKRGTAVELRDVVRTFIQFAHALTAALAPRRRLFRDRAVEVLGLPLVKPYFEQKRGVLFVTAHIGPWDLAAMKLRGFVDTPVMMLMSHEQMEQAAAFQDEVRENEEIRVLRVGKTPFDALPLVQHLREGGLVVAQVDRVPEGGEALEARLFGRPFRLPLGLFRLAGALRCPLVPVLCGRQGGGGDLVRLSPPLTVPRRPTEAQLLQAANDMAGRLEAHLREFPTQWFHFVPDS